jgi:hypothetical protein
MNQYVRTCMSHVALLITFFLIGIVGGAVQLGPLDTAATNRPIVPALGDYDDGELGGMIGRGNRSTCPNAALSTTNPTCCPDADSGRRGGKPASNRLSYGMALGFTHLSAWFRTEEDCKGRPATLHSLSE